MPSFVQLLGMAMVILALTGPLAYCGIQDEANKAALKRACMEAKAPWNGWDVYCDFTPKP